MELLSPVPKIQCSLKYLATMGKQRTKGKFVYQAAAATAQTLACDMWYKMKHMEFRISTQTRTFGLK